VLDEKIMIIMYLGFLVEVYLYSATWTRRLSRIPGRGLPLLGRFPRRGEPLLGNLDSLLPFGLDDVYGRRVQPSESSRFSFFVYKT